MVSDIWGSIPKFHNPTVHCHFYRLGKAVKPSAVFLGQFFFRKKTTDFHHIFRRFFWVDGRIRPDCDGRNNDGIDSDGRNYDGIDCDGRNYDGIDCDGRIVTIEIGLTADFYRHAEIFTVSQK